MTESKRRMDHQDTKDTKGNSYGPFSVLASSGLGVLGALGGEMFLLRGFA